MDVKTVLFDGSLFRVVNQRDIVQVDIAKYLVKDRQYTPHSPAYPINKMPGYDVVEAEGLVYWGRYENVNNNIPVRVLTREGLTRLMIDRAKSERTYLQIDEINERLRKLYLSWHRIASEEPASNEVIASINTLTEMKSMMKPTTTIGEPTRVTYDNFTFRTDGKGIMLYDIGLWIGTKRGYNPPNTINFLHYKQQLTHNERNNPDYFYFVRTSNGRVSEFVTPAGLEVIIRQRQKTSAWRTITQTLKDFCEVMPTLIQGISVNETAPAHEEPQEDVRVIEMSNPVDVRGNPDLIAFLELIDEKVKGFRLEIRQLKQEMAEVLSENENLKLQVMNLTAELNEAKEKTFDIDLDALSNQFDWLK